MPLPKTIAAIMRGGPQGLIPMASQTSIISAIMKTSPAMTPDHAAALKSVPGDKLSFGVPEPFLKDSAMMCSLLLRTQLAKERLWSFYDNFGNTMRLSDSA